MTTPDINSQKVYDDVLYSAWELYHDTDERDDFYSKLGIVRTELENGEALDEHSVLYKDEGLQPSGSYKLRGITWRLAVGIKIANQHRRNITEAHCVSTGNHGIAQGFAAKKLGLTSVVHAPDSITPEKEELIRRNSQLIKYPSFDKARLAAEDQERHVGVIFAHPFDHIDTIAGQFSLGQEIVDDLESRGIAFSDVTIPASIAGGGHISGIAIAVRKAKAERRLGDGVRVLGVQPYRTDAMRRRIKHGNQPRISPKASLFAKGEFDSSCDALAIQDVGKLPTRIVADPEFVSDIHLVDKVATFGAMIRLYKERGQWYEPAAALPLAYAMSYEGPATTFVLPLTGRNVSTATIGHYRRAYNNDRWERFKALPRPGVREYDPVKESGKVAERREPPRGAHPALGGYVRE